MDPSVQAFYTALNNYCSLEVVNEHLSVSQLRVMSRVHQRGMEAWLEIMKRLLRASNSAPWNIDLSKQYFLDASQNSILYGWRIILQTAPPNAILSFIPAVTQLVTAGAAGPVAAEMTEVPLHGSPMRHLGPNQKGARPVRDAS